MDLLAGSNPIPDGVTQDVHPENGRNRTLQVMSDAQGQVFNNLELMELVFWLGIKSPGSLTRFEKRSLLRVALAARCFYNPAMNVLWRNMTSIIPVMKLVPPGHPKIPEILLSPTNDSTGPLGELSMTQMSAISSRQPEAIRNIQRFWPILEQYCQRVRRLDLTNERGWHLQEKNIYFFQLLHALHPFKLFSTLSTFKMSLDNFPRDRAPVLNCIMTRTLTSVSFVKITPDDVSIVTALLHRLLYLIPRPLVHLELRGSLDLDILRLVEASGVRDVVLELNLEGQSEFFEESLAIVTRICHVTGLEIIFPSQDPDIMDDEYPVLPDYHAGSVFCGTHLKTLSLTGFTSDLHAFLRAIGPLPVLTELIFQYVFPRSRRFAEDCAIQERCISAATTQAPFIHNFQVCSEDHEMQISWDSLDHIKRWKHLKWLDINLPYGHFTCLSPQSVHHDRDLWRFRDWNSLTFLGISDSMHVSSVPAVEHTGISPLLLSAITLCCPRLQHLEIGFYLPVEDAPLAQMQTEVNGSLHNVGLSNADPHPLRKLLISDIHMLDDIKFDDMGLEFWNNHNSIYADYLRHLFPLLNEVEYGPYEDEGKAWEAHMKAIVRDRLNI